MLGEALFALLAEKDYRAITVRDITNRADVGYMTFYRHYENKDALLVEQLQTMIQAAMVGFTDDCHEIGLVVFRFVEQNSRLFRVVLSNDELSIARQWIRDRIAALLLHAPDVLPTEPHPVITREVAAMHIASSILNLIAWWLSQGQPYPVERMGQIYQQMILYPTIHSLQLKSQI